MIKRTHLLLLSQSTLLALLLIPHTLTAQNPDWAWAVSAGENELDIGRAVETDQSGNVYVAGNFSSSTITFGDFTLAGTASTNLFIVKYDNLGNVIWAEASEGTGSISCHDMAIDPDGNVYLAGYFGSLSVIFENTTLVGQGSDDAFIAKYSPDGDVIYALGFGNSGGDKIHGIDCAADGSLLVTGFYNSSSLNLGGISISNSHSGLNTFLAKYNPEGNALWAIDIGGDGPDWGREVAVGMNGDVYLTGHYSSSVFSIGNLQLTNVFADDVFIAKVNGDGGVLWAKSASGTTSNSLAIALGLVLDETDNAYITGSFYGDDIAFGSISLTNTSESSYNDFFIAKYDEDGNEQWARSGGGQLGEEGRAVSLTPDGNIRATGFHQSKQYFRKFDY